MKKILALLLISFLAFSCKTPKSASDSSTGSKISVMDFGSKKVKLKLKDENTFLIKDYSKDPTYGYNMENPVMVGGALDSEGPINEKRFLNALKGPNGEDISYHRLGSCCHFKTKNGFLDGGLLDKYEVSFKGLDSTVVLYINMYDSDKLMVPVGFTLAE